MTTLHPERETLGQCREKATRRNSKRGDFITTNRTGTLNLDILPGEQRKSKFLLLKILGLL